MKNILIIISLVLAFSLALNIIFILRIKSINAAFSKKQSLHEDNFFRNPLEELEDLNDELKRFKLFESYFKKMSPPTEKIDPNPAKQITSNYRSNISNSSNRDSTKAVWFEISKILGSLMKQKNLENIYDPEKQLKFAGFYAYLGRYGATDKHPYQTTIIIQPGIDSLTVDTNFIYNFGGLCPKNCPNDKFLLN